mgnify:CR=1 FL=1|tara:strand:+ start:55 stop:306 length:252 start_codon:yes stop_codon:yes gene_type:complete
MPYYVYVLKNTSKSKLTTYVGYTKDLKTRLKLHNKGQGAKFTRGRIWKIMYFEKYSTKKEAISREYYIKKNRKIRDQIKKKFK